MREITAPPVVHPNTSVFEDFGGIELPLPSTKLDALQYPYDATFVLNFWKQNGRKGHACNTDVNVAMGIEGSLLGKPRLLNEIEQAVLQSYHSLFLQLEVQVSAYAMRSGLEFDPLGLHHTIIAGVARPLYELITRTKIFEYCNRNTSRDIQESYSSSFIEVMQTQTETTAAIWLQPYPALKRRIDNLVHQFLGHIEALLSRLGADFERVNEDLWGNQGKRLVAHIEFLGDAHQGGACVSRVDLIAKNGAYLHVVYKPRSLHIDLAFAGFLNQISALENIQFFTPRYIVYKDYGWTEYVSHKSCHTSCEVREYYRRLGWLLALIHALNGTDVHAGNVIAFGAYPVIVDLECLLSPILLKEIPATTSSSLNLILSTAMVPMMRMPAARHPGFDVSAFSGQGGIEHIYHDWVLTHGNSRTPTIERQPKIIERRRNRPILNGIEIDSFDYELEFIGGFEQGYRILLDKRETLLVEGGGLSKFAGVEIRVVLRNTGEYLKAVYESTHPRLLLSLEASEAFYRRITRGLFTALIQDSEVESLLHGTVPRFSMLSNEFILRDLKGRIIPIAIQRNGYEHMREHISYGMSQQALVEQTQLLKQCLGIMRINRRYLAIADIEEQNYSNSSLVQLIHGVLDVLERNNVGQPIPAWYSVEVSRGGSYVVTRSDWSLWKGNAGVMLAYSRALQQTEHSGARLALQAGFKFLRSQARPEDLLPGRSGYLGVGGIVYLLSALQHMPGFEVSNDRFQEFLNVQLATAQGAMSPGFAGIAGDILLLVAAKQLCDIPAIGWCLEELAGLVIESRVFAALKRGSTAEQLIPKEHWSGNLALLLALLRYARLLGHHELHLQCSKIVSRLSHECDSYMDVLGLAALHMELPDDSTRVSVLRALVRRLNKLVERQCLSHQYGLGSFLGMLERLVDCGVIDNKELDLCSREYIARAANNVRIFQLATSSQCFVSDLSRGFAGLLLRMLGMCDIKWLSSPFPC